MGWGESDEGLRVGVWGVLGMLGEGRGGPQRWYVVGKVGVLVALGGVVAFREALGLGVVATLGVLFAMIVLTAHLFFLLTT